MRNEGVVQWKNPCLVCARSWVDAPAWQTKTKTASILNNETTLKLCIYFYHEYVSKCTALNIWQPQLFTTFILSNFQNQSFIRLPKLASNFLFMLEFRVVGMTNMCHFTRLFTRIWFLKFFGVRVEFHLKQTTIFINSWRTQYRVFWSHSSPLLQEHSNFLMLKSHNSCLCCPYTPGYGTTHWEVFILEFRMQSFKGSPLKSVLCVCLSVKMSTSHSIVGYPSDTTASLPTVYLPSFNQTTQCAACVCDVITITFSKWRLDTKL